MSRRPKARIELAVKTVRLTGWCPMCGEVLRYWVDPMVEVYRGRGEAVDDKGLDEDCWICEWCHIEFPLAYEVVEHASASYTVEDYDLKLNG